MVEVGAQGEICGVGRTEPVGQGAGGAGGERDDGVAPEGAVGFLVVGKRVVARDASTQSLMGAPASTPRTNVVLT